MDWPSELLMGGGSRTVPFNQLAARPCLLAADAHQCCAASRSPCSWPRPLRTLHRRSRRDQLAGGRSSRRRSSRLRPVALRPWRPRRRFARPTSQRSASLGCRRCARMTPARLVALNRLTSPAVRTRALCLTARQRRGPQWRQKARPSFVRVEGPRWRDRV